MEKSGFPAIPVSIFNPKTKAGIQGVPAIIDTGSAHCLIQEVIVTRLGLEVIRMSSGTNPQYGKIEMKFYEIDLVIDIFNSEKGAALLPKFTVGTINEPNYPTAMIIGIDFLNLCDFQFNGREKTFQIHLVF